MAETTEAPLWNENEPAKVESWRLHILLEAGYPVHLAERGTREDPVAAPLGGILAELRGDPAGEILDRGPESAFRDGCGGRSGGDGRGEAVAVRPLGVRGGAAN